jgi:hypothetical protein
MHVIMVPLLTSFSLSPPYLAHTYQQTTTEIMEEADQIRNRFPFEPEREEDGSLIIDKVRSAECTHVACDTWDTRLGPYLLYF